MNMFSDHSLLVFICMLTALITVAFAVAVKGIYFYGRKTDNHSIINAAACAGQWGTLSGMHKFAHAKAHMKEFAVLALAFMQRLLGDTHSDYPLVVLCAVANAVSAVLIYLIAVHYWGVVIAVLLFSLFICSFWPPMIALWGGVVALAQAVALGSIYCLQLAEASAGVGQLAWYGSAGVMLALVIFSSASSRKYLPLIAAAFFWSLRKEFFGQGGSSGGAWIAAAFATALAAGTVVFRMNGRRLMEMIYARRAPGFLNGLINNRNRLLSEYMGIMDKITAALAKAVFLILAYLLINILLVPSDVYWSAHAAVFIGFSCTVFIFVFPNVKQALWGYYIYSQYGKPIWRSRFYSYRDFFASIGHPISDDMRGAGWPWVLRYFYLMVPVPLYFYAAGVGLLVLTQAAAFRFDHALAGLIIVILSLSPVLMAEFSKAVQVGRSYFPAFLGILLLIGFAFSTVLAPLDPMIQNVLWALTWTLVTASVIMNMMIFLTDVLPSRLSINRLVALLRTHGIKKFYTYDTSYNEVFLHCMPEQVKKEFDICFIKSITDVQQGYVVIPPVNVKSATMSDFPLAQRSANVFEEDQELNAMIDSKSIEGKALASLPTMGSSRIWLHEAEVPSFRDLILKEITPLDFYRGKAWVLKV